MTKTAYKASQEVLLLKEAVKKGLLLHGSAQKLRVLNPQQANCTTRITGNFRAIYATHLAAYAIRIALTMNRLMKKRNEPLYVYLCKRDFFTKADTVQHISLKAVKPYSLVTLHRKKAESFLSRQEPHYPTNNTLVKEDTFWKRIAKIALDHTCMPANNTIHGYPHSVATASLGKILAQQECPESTKEVIVGCFLHDIGRESDTEGIIHAKKSVRIAYRLIKEFFPEIHPDELLYAIHNHTEGKTTENKIIGCIWDADRLGTVRMLQEINGGLLSTKSAKTAAKILNAILRNNLKKHAAIKVKQ